MCTNPTEYMLCGVHKLFINYSTSYAGDTRIKIPMSKLKELTPNLYFAHSYCKELHKQEFYYVTLVATSLDSLADNYCQGYLV